MKRIAMLSTAALAAAVLIFTGCSDEKSDGGTYKPPPEEVTPPENGLWASFESKFNRYCQGQKHPGQTNAAKIQTQWGDTVWINDRTHTQVMVWANQQSYTNLSYEVSDLESGGNIISKSNISVSFGSYVKGHVDVWACQPLEGESTARINVADALSKTPVTAISATDDPIKLWITINTPKTATAGRYTGTVKVKVDGEAVQTLNMSLLVVNRVLPDVADWTFHLDMWQYPFQLVNFCTPAVTFASDEYFAMIEPFYRLLANTGQKCITAYIKGSTFERGEIMLPWTKKTNGTWEYDFTKFDKYIQKMMDWGINKQIDCFISGWRTNIDYYDEATSSNVSVEFLSQIYAADNPTMHVIGDELYRELWTTFFTAFKTHMQQKGWLSKVVFYMDESSHADMVNIVETIHDHDPNWKIGVAGNGMGELENDLYDYCVFLGRQNNKTTPVHTFYTCCSNKYPTNYVSQKTDPAELVWMGWHAAGNGFNGYLRWGYDFWGTSDFNDAAHTGRWAFTAGDGNMVYRLNNTTNANAVVNTIRLEMLRLGIQDYEKIRILNNGTVNSFADNNFDIPYNDWVTINAIGQKARTPVTNGEALLKRMSVN